MTTAEMVKKADKAGGYFKFTAPRMVNGVLTPTHLEATQRDVDTRTGDKLDKTATDFYHSEYQKQGRLVSREQAEAILAEMED